MEKLSRRKIKVTPSRFVRYEYIYLGKNTFATVYSRCQRLLQFKYKSTYKDH